MKDVNNKEEVVNLIIPDGNPEILELINNIKAVLEARVPKTNNDKVYLSESEVGAINELTKSIDDTLKYLKDNNISSDSESNKYRLDTKISKIFVSSLIDNGIVDGIAEESNEYTKLFGGMTKLMEYIRNNISSDKPDGQINDCFSFDDSEKQSLSSMFGSVLKNNITLGDGYIIDNQIEDILSVYKLASALGLKELPVYCHAFSEGETDKDKDKGGFNSDGYLSTDITEGETISPSIDISHFTLKGQAKTLVNKLLELGFAVKKNKYGFNMTSGEQTEIIISW